MKIEGNIRINRSPHGVEVMVQGTDSAVSTSNFAIYLPAGTEIKDGEPIEFVQVTDKPVSEEELKRRAAELPG